MGFTKESRFSPFDLGPRIVLQDHAVAVRVFLGAAACLPVRVERSDLPEPGGKHPGAGFVPIIGVWNVEDAQVFRARWPTGLAIRRWCGLVGGRCVRSRDTRAHYSPRRERPASLERSRSRGSARDRPSRARRARSACGSCQRQRFVVLPPIARGHFQLLARKRLKVIVHVSFLRRRA